MASFEKAVEQKNKHSEVRKTENAENRNKTLHWGTKTNYRKWSENMESIMSEMYDINADFITTGKMIEYHEPEPVYEEFRKEVDPLGIKKAIYKEECIEAYKNRAKLAKVKIAMWATIWMTLSEMSKEKVKERKEYEEALADNKNVSTLWKLISLVHSTAGTGNEINDRLNAKEVIEKMEQGQKESILSFKNRLMDAFKTSVELGANEESVEVQIQDFLRKLDKKRFGNFYLKLKESVTMKYGQYPKSVNEAVELATNYSNSMNYDLLLSNENNIKSNIETVFIAKTDDENKTKKKKLRKESNDKIVSKEDIDNDNVIYYPNIQCHKCLQFGHYKSNCPTWNSVEKTDEIKLFKQKQSKKKTEIEMINIISIKDDDDNKILSFKKKNEIINNRVFMDSCASVSLFNNKNLLTNIRKCKKNYNILGINAEALTVSLEGDLLHFGTVLYSKNAVANILSLSKVEKLLTVDYKQEFGFSVFTKSHKEVYHFKRIEDGRYTAEFHNTKNVLVNSYSEKRKVYPKQSVNVIQIERTFQKRIDYVPVCTTKDMIDRKEDENLNNNDESSETKSNDEIIDSDKEKVTLKIVTISTKKNSSEVKTLTDESVANNESITSSVDYIEIDKDQNKSYEETTLIESTFLNESEVVIEKNQGGKLIQTNFQQNYTEDNQYLFSKCGIFNSNIIVIYDLESCNDEGDEDISLKKAVNLQEKEMLFSLNKRKIGLTVIKIDDGKVIINNGIDIYSYIENININWINKWIKSIIHLYKFIPYSNEFDDIKYVKVRMKKNINDIGKDCAFIESVKIGEILFKDDDNGGNSKLLNISILKEFKSILMKLICFAKHSAFNISIFVA